MKINWGFIVLVFSFLFVETISLKLSIYPDLHHSTSRRIKNVNSSEYEYETKFLEVPLDHFSFSVNVTFKMRYLLNDTWQKTKDAPIFLYTGNEAFIEVFAQNTGFMWDLAPEYGALLVFAEHRYYGESKPLFEDGLYYSNPKNLGYLNSQQAIADYVKLISVLKSKPNMKNSPVIVFGGSYAGMLSAWMRMKYPHIVQGAIASSAPILQFTGHTDCGTFAKIVTSDFERADPICPELIRKTWSTITNITSTNEGLRWLSKTWKLCKPLRNSTDASVFKNWLHSIYDYLAMVDYPYESNFMKPLPAKPISAVCKHLKNSTLSGKQLLISLFRGISVFTNYTGETKCNNFEDTDAKVDEKLWNYQACSEMVMPLCTDGINDMFEPFPWNEENYSYGCFKKFRAKPQFNMTCMTYGCTDLSGASNIVFSNGMLDPWYGGGVLRNISSSAVAYIIPEAAHHLELRSANPKDPFSVREARSFHRHHITRWIKNYQSQTDF